MADGIEFDASSFDELGRQLRSAADHVERELNHALLKIGADIAGAAAAIAADSGSKSIPATIKLIPARGQVMVRAGSPDHPIAELWELGNKGSRRSSKTFRHPVFGTDVWVEQPKHPFLAPARLAMRRSSTRHLEQAWERVLEPYSIRPRWSL